MIRVGFKSDTGMSRENNEDSCFVMPKEKVYMVADGVGGNNTGERASGMVVTSIAKSVKKSFFTRLRSDEEICRALNGYIEKANKKVIDYALKHRESYGMATTIVLCYLKGNKAYFANAGDSRAYICRKNQLHQITEDHSYVNTLLKQGAISIKEAEEHENRHMITKAVGAETEVSADYYQVEIMSDDVIILCTDGLYSELKDCEITELISNEHDMSELAEKLVVKANLNGGRDNITVICLKVEGGI